MVLEFRRYTTSTYEDASEARYLIARRDLEPDSYIQFQDFSFVTARKAGGRVPAEALTDQDLFRASMVWIFLAPRRTSGGLDL